MLFVIALLLSTCSSGILTTQALPTSISSIDTSPIQSPHDHGLSSFSSSLQATPRDTGAPSLRSTWDILWSCLATIFACTWVSVHPNSPGINPGRWTATLRRLELMMWGLLAPEMIMLWALRQWVGARKLTKLYKGYFTGWTITHSHFLQMGGFALLSGKEDIQVLSPKKFHIMIQREQIGFPKISAEEIKALGKGDGLSKAIVLCQTLWFIAQCISRAADGLVITEIELVTCAFCFLNGFMYFLWWDKPLDATFVIRLPRTDWHPEIPINQNVLSPWPYGNGTSSIQISRRVFDESSTDVDRLETGPSMAADVEAARNIDEPPPAHLRLDNDASNVSPGDSSSIYSTGRVINIRRTDFSRIYYTIALLWRRLYEMQGATCDTNIRGRTALPMFGALVGVIDANSNSAFIHHSMAIAVVAIVFGGIHCAAWSFPFASYAERIIWRVASSIIVLIPIIYLAVTFPAWPYVKRIYTGEPRRAPRRANRYSRPNIFEYGCVSLRWPMMKAMVPIYLLARLVLLIEAFVGLRNLLPGAFVEVVWSKFVPHI